MPLTPGESERQIPTDVWTLDRFDGEMGRQDRILLWMDIEGSELPALRGVKALREALRGAVEARREKKRVRVTEME